MITLSIMYGYLAEKRNWVRVLLACSAVPITLATNSLRIIGTGLMAYWAPDHAEGFFHASSGWVAFLVALLLMLDLHRLINLVRKAHPGRKVSTLLQAEPGRNS